MRFSLYVVWHSNLSLSYLEVLKIHKPKVMKNIRMHKNYTLVDFYNSGLALIGFRTTRHCLQQVNMTCARDPIENQHLVGDQLQKNT